VLVIDWFITKKHDHFCYNVYSCTNAYNNYVRRFIINWSMKEINLYSVCTKDVSKCYMVVDFLLFNVNSLYVPLNTSMRSDGKTHNFLKFQETYRHPKAHGNTYYETQCIKINIVKHLINLYINNFNLVILPFHSFGHSHKFVGFSMTSFTTYQHKCMCPNYFTKWTYIKNHKK